MILVLIAHLDISVPFKHMKTPPVMDLSAVAKRAQLILTLALLRMDSISTLPFVHAEPAKSIALLVWVFISSRMFLLDRPSVHVLVVLILE